MPVKALTAAVLIAAAAIFIGTGTLRAADSDTPSDADSSIPSFTKASQNVVLSFTRPGRVVKILVKAGDPINEKQLLAQQDDSEEQAEYEYANAQATDKTKVDAQEKIRDQKSKVLERKRAANYAVNANELEEAQLDWEVAIAQTALAVFEHIQDSRKLDQAEAVLSKTKLLSPINGVVQEVFVQEGESVDSQSMKVMRVVNVDPLYIDVPVNFALAQKIKVSDNVHIVFSDNTQGSGTVLAVSPMADGASGTRNVRLTVKNEAKRPGGERVLVSFDAAGKVAAGDK